MKNFAIQYIKGCALCQSRKNITTRPKPPQFPITTNPEVQPFECIALDFITKLPPSEEYDLILMITDHDCSKGSIFIPCKETIDAIGVAELYSKHIFPHYCYELFSFLYCTIRHNRLPRGLACTACTGVSSRTSLCYYYDAFTTLCIPL